MCAANIYCEFISDSVEMSFFPKQKNVSRVAGEGFCVLSLRSLQISYSKVIGMDKFFLRIEHGDAAIDTTINRRCYPYNENARGNVQFLSVATCIPFVAIRCITTTIIITSTREFLIRGCNDDYSKYWNLN